MRFNCKNAMGAPAFGVLSLLILPFPNPGVVSVEAQAEATERPRTITTTERSVDLIPVKYTSDRETDTRSALIRGTRVNSSSIVKLFPVEEKWEFRGYHCRSASDLWMMALSIQEARGTNTEVARVQVAGAPTGVDLILAFRTVPIAESVDGVNGEIVIAQVVDKDVTVLTRSSIVGRALPSREAVARELLDKDNALAPRLRFLDIGGEPARIDVVSWNGSGSFALVEAKRDQFSGGHRVGFSMSDDVVRRTSGKLSTWPEPVWCVEVAVERREKK